MSHILLRYKWREYYMEEEGEDQEDKWTREKLDQIQPTNPDIHSLFLHWTRTVPTKTRSTNCKSTNTEQKHNQIASPEIQGKILLLQLVRRTPPLFLGILGGRK